MRFKYTAIDKTGREVKGIEESESMQTVIVAIREKGFFPVKVVPTEKAGIKPLIVRGNVKIRILALSTRQLSTLLSAGLPLVRAIRVLEEQQPAGTWKKVLKGVGDSIEGGSSFSEALGRYPNVFSKLYINMVRAGESAGLLDLVLTRLADYHEKNQKLRSKVLSALIYPCLVLGMALLILSGLMIFVVPKFAEMFKDMGVELPFMTKLLINASSYMLTLKFWIIVIAMIFIVQLGFKSIKNLSKGRYFLDAIKLKIPVVGKLTQKIVISRFARTLGTLVSSGVPILNALNIVKETVGNEVVASGLSIVHNSVKEGESVVSPLRQVAVFDPIVLNMVAVGEETGKLDEMLEKIADTYESDVDIMIASMTSLLEPLLIVTLAIIIGFIVISLFLPLVKLLTTLAG
jgi:type IV pilus assembly protein PilC